MPVWAGSLENTMLGNVLAALGLIPKLIDLLNRLGRLIKEKELEAWLNDLEQTTTKLEKAETSEDKTAAVRDLVNLINRM